MAELVHRITAHLLISVTGVAFAAAAGIIIGILLTYAEKLAGLVMGAIEVLQTIPSLAMLSILLIFFGLGNITAIMAIFFYSLLPIVRNTYTGIQSVEPFLIEAGRGMGMNNLQVLLKVQIPNAVPVIVSGLRISLITAYGIVTIAVLVGGGGLGRYVYRGTQTQDMGMLLTGAIPISLMAFFTDLMLNKLEGLLNRRVRASKNPEN
ncbi:MAG TPA: ABC transporter permease [Clostridia bacterium]|nr:ABC transporter permease [Clostridia bacterium]